MFIRIVRNSHSVMVLSSTISVSNITTVIYLTDLLILRSPLIWIIQLKLQATFAF